MARTREELRELITVLEQLKVAASGDLQASLERANAAIGKIASGKTTGYQELISAFKNIKTEIRGIDPEGIYKVNTALAETIRLTNELKRAGSAASGLTAPESRRLRALETPYVPAQVRSRLAEEANIQRVRAEVYTPRTQGETVPWSVQRQARRDMNAEFERRAEPYLKAIEEQTQAAKEAANKRKEITANQKEVENQVNRAMDDLKKSIDSETRARYDTVQSVKRLLSDSEKLAKEQEEVQRQRLKAEGEMYYANQRAAGVGINRPESVYGQPGQAATATRLGDAEAVRSKIRDTEAAADLKQNELLREHIKAKQEQIKLEADLLKIKQEVLRVEGETTLEAYEKQGEMFPRGGVVATPLNAQSAVFEAFGRNTQKAAEFERKLRDLGFRGLENINRVSKDAASGITTLSASFTDLNGVANEAIVHIDRFGNIVQSQSNNFKSFGDILAHNVTKVIQWTVAIGLVYGAINKLQEVFGNMSELQNLLNDLTITANLTGDALQETFGAVVNIANQVGLSAVDSLKAMNYALKVTGESSSPTKRTADALQLLSASLTLSKLAGMDQAEAMDELVASLEQANLEYGNATKLLDSFQAVAKVSGGSIDDMTSTFGITAAAALDVGIKVDELNGIIGAFASITTKSAEETGTALKVIFANIQTDKAIAVLQKYGIAVREFGTGEVRNFMDIVDELNARIKSGLIDEKGQSEIALKVSGGSRRAADWTAITKNWEKVGPLVQVSAKAQGDAQDALSIKSQTLNSAVQRLNNSFLELSNTLGARGGFVDLMTSVVNVLDSIVKAANSLTNALGPMTSAIAALAAIGIGNKLFGNRIKEVFTSLAAPLIAARTPTAQGPSIAERLASVGAGQSGFVQVSEQGGKAFGDKAVGGIKGFITGGFLNALTPVLGLAFVTAMQGNGVQAATGLVAGAFMAGVTKSSGWAAIGSILAMTIVSQVQSLIDYANKGQAAVAAGMPTYAEFKVTQPKATPEEYQEEIRTRTQDIVNSQLLFGNRAMQVMTGLNNVDRYNLARQQKEYLEKAAPDLFRQYLTAGRTGDYRKEYDLGNQLSEILRSGKLDVATKAGKSYPLAEFERQILVTGNNFKAIDLVTEGLKIGFEELAEITKQAADAQNNLYQSQVAFNQEFSTKSTENLNTLRTSLLIQMGQPGSQVSTGPQYRKALEQGGLAQVLTPQVLAAQHPEVKTIEEARKFSAEYDSLFDTLSRANEERINFIGELATEISRLNDLIISGKSANIALDKQELAESQKLLAIQLQLAEVEAARAQIVYPGFEDQREMTKNQVLKAARDAERVQSYVVGQMGIDPNLFKKSLDDIYILTKDGLLRIKGLSKDFFSPAIDGIKQMQKELENAFNFQNLRDYPIDIANRLQQAMNYYQNLLKQWGLNEKIEKFTFLFKDNQVAQLIGSQTALQLALQDLTAVEKKQLDGIYNLPSGATAFIPLQAGQMLANYSQNQVGPAPFDYGNFPTPALTSLGQVPLKIDETNNILRGMSTELKKTIAIPERPEDKERLRDIGRPPKVTPKEVILPVVGAGGLKVPNEKPPATMQDLLLQQLNTAMFQPLSILLNMMKGLMNIKQLTSGGLDISGNAGKPSTGPFSVNVQVKPEKVTNEFSTNIVLRVDGRVLATVLKKYLFEDYQRLTAAVGRTSRSTTGVIV